MGDAPDERDDFSDWEQAEGEARAALGETLVVDVEGFEGPLDLLLALARTQKVDLARISVLALAQQYLDFIAEARKLRLEIAADYLVMAAWLAFLKSKLLLPAEQEADGEPPYVSIRDGDGKVLARWAIRHAHGLWVDSRGDIYLGLTTNHSVDKYVRAA